MANLLFGISYLGTNYSGWQKQDNALAIQELVEDAIFQITKEKVEIFASGRTDAGVNALEQCFNCNLKFKDYKNLPRALNSILPNDVKILWVRQVPDNFHARYSAHKKTYLYRFKTNNIASPFDFNTTAYVNYSLSLEKMQKACTYLVGEKDFSAFCSSGATVKDFVRIVYKAKLLKQDDTYIFEITGNGFLYNMVRIIVGTIIDVGRGKILPEQIKEIIDGKDRQKAGKTMPACGLFLKKVEYDL